MPTATLPQFRGVDTCTRRAYMTITSSSYGRGSTFTFGALSRNANFTKQGQLSFQDTALIQALNRFEKFGVIEYVGQSSSENAGSPLHARRYRVLRDRDERALARPEKRKARPRVVKHAETATPTVPTPATVKSETSNEHDHSDLEARIVELELRFAAVVKQLQSVSA